MYFANFSKKVLVSEMVKIIVSMLRSLPVSVSGRMNLVLNLVLS